MTTDLCRDVSGPASYVDYSNDILIILRSSLGESDT